VAPNKITPSKSLKVGFYGNNINLAFNVVNFLTRAGFHCTWIGFANSSISPQDNPSWQGKSLDMIPRRVILGNNPLFNPLSSEYRVIKSKISSLCRDIDILFMSEDGPCWFADQKLPKFFVSQGGDLQDYPFFLQRTLLQLFTCPSSLFLRSTYSLPVQAVSSISPCRNKFSLRYNRIASILLTFSAKLLRQFYQRRGLHLSDKLFITPNQISITDRLHISRTKIHFLPLPSFVNSISHTQSASSCNESLNFVENLSHSKLILFSPTRVLLESKAKVFAKYNNYLIKSLSLLSNERLSQLQLVLIRKGSYDDLSRLDTQIDSLSLSQNVCWIPEQPAFELVNFYRIKNLIICDQFSDKLAYLGAIGREASHHGKPLLTAFSDWNSLYYGLDFPPHVFPCFCPEDISCSIDTIMSLDQQQLSILSSKAKHWYKRWHSPSASIKRFIHTTFSA
jgi:glycosyltransferase involved in cell wall biosynthesis